MVFAKEVKCIEDLYEKYPTFSRELIQDIYSVNGKDLRMADFELKELAHEPAPTPKKPPSQEESMIDEKPLTPNLSTGPSREEASGGKTFAEQNATEEAELLNDFQQDHMDHKPSKEEITSITQIIREGQRGVDYKEELFLREQFESDFMLLQQFIVKKYDEISKIETTDAGVNIHNRAEFPSIVNTQLNQGISSTEKA